MSAPSSPSASTSQPILGSTGVGAFSALGWGIKRLVTAPALLVFVAVAGSGLGLVQPNEFGPTQLALGLVNLVVTAVTYRHTGLAFDDVENTRDLIEGALWSVPRLVGAWIWFGIGLLILFFLILLTGVIGILFALPAIVLFVIHTILAFPAVCIDQDLINGLFAGWDYARGARWTLLGLLLVTSIPLMVLETRLTGSSPIVLVGFGAVYGCVLAASNLAFARVYVSQRSLREAT